MGRADTSKRDSCVCGQGLGKLSGKGQSVNDLGFAGPAGLCCKFSALLLKHGDTQTAKTILGKENRHGGIKLPDVCPHYKDISSKQCGINTKTHIDQ